MAFLDHESNPLSPVYSLPWPRPSLCFQLPLLLPVQSVVHVPLTKERPAPCGIWVCGPFYCLCQDTPFISRYSSMTAPAGICFISATVLIRVQVITNDGSHHACDVLL